MDARQIAILVRGDKGDVVLEYYSSVYVLNLQMIAKKLEIVDRIILIRSYDVIAKSATIGLTSMKDVDCLVMGGKGIVAVSQMKEYFTNPLTADPIEFAKIDFSLTDLIKGAAADVYDRNMVVSGVFDNYLTDMILNDYPVTMAMGAGYADSIVTYNTAVPGFGNGEVVRSAANAQIVIECQRLTNLNFPSIKNFTLAYKELHTMFYDQILFAYQSNSVTERKECIKLHVTESVSGIDVVGYAVSLIASDGTIIPGVGSDKGLKTFKSLKTDVYSMLLVRAGYVEKRILGIAYTAGKILRIATTMVLAATAEEVVADVAVKEEAAKDVVVIDGDTVITDVTAEGIRN